MQEFFWRSDFQWSYKIAIIESRDSKFAKIDFTENLNGRKILEFPHCEKYTTHDERLTHNFHRNTTKWFSGKSTVWKLHDFSVTQILREIKVGESKICYFEKLQISEPLKL